MHETDRNMNMVRTGFTSSVTEILSQILFRNKYSGYIMLFIPVFIILFLFFLPHFSLLGMSFWTMEANTPIPAASIENYKYLFTNKLYIESLIRSIFLSISVSIICLIIGYPIALYMTRVKIRFRAVIVFILFTPMFVSVVIRSFGWLVLLERNGVLNSILLEMGVLDEPVQFLNSFGGVVIGMVNVMLVFMIIPLVSSLSSVPRSLEEAAHTLGAGRVRTWWHITWPLSSPGVVTGVLLVFAITLSSYVLPRLLGGAAFFIYPTQIWRQVMSVLNWPLGAAMGVILIIVAFLMSRFVSWAAHFAFPYYRQLPSNTRASWSRMR